MLSCQIMAAEVIEYLLLGHDFVVTGLLQLLELICHSMELVVGVIVYPPTYGLNCPYVSRHHYPHFCDYAICPWRASGAYVSKHAFWQ